MGQFISKSGEYIKELYWDNTLEPTRKTYPNINNQFGLDAPFPTLPRDWIEVDGLGVGLQNVVFTVLPLAGRDGSDLIMSIYRHANSRPFKFFVIYKNKNNFVKVFGYDMTVFSAESISFDIAKQPPTHKVTLKCFGRLMSESRDLYIEGSSFELARFNPPNKNFLDYNNQTAIFNIGKILVGTISGATAIIKADSNVLIGNGQLTLLNVNGKFKIGEIITDSGSLSGSAIAQPDQFSNLPNGGGHFRPV